MVHCCRVFNNAREYGNVLRCTGVGGDQRIDPGNCKCVKNRKNSARADGLSLVHDAPGDGTASISCIDRCASKDCGNGKCNQGNCECNAGWNGAACKNNINDCADKDCGSNGSCVKDCDTTGNCSTSCTCVDGYTGVNCEIDPTTVTRTANTPTTTQPPDEAGCESERNGCSNCYNDELGLWCKCGYDQEFGTYCNKTTATTTTATTTAPDSSELGTAEATSSGGTVIGILVALLVVVTAVTVTLVLCRKTPATAARAAARDEFQQEEELRNTYQMEENTMLAASQQRAKLEQSKAKRTTAFDTPASVAPSAEPFGANYEYVDISNGPNTILINGADHGNVDYLVPVAVEDDSECPYVTPNAADNAGHGGNDSDTYEMPDSLPDANASVQSAAASAASIDDIVDDHVYAAVAGDEVTMCEYGCGFSCKRGNGAEMGVHQESCTSFYATPDGDGGSATA